MKNTVLHTVEAGNETPHKIGNCEQCDLTRERIKLNAHNQFHLGGADFPYQNSCYYCLTKEK